MLFNLFKERDFLIASIQAALTDDDLVKLRNELVRQVCSSHPRGGIVDVTRLHLMDSFAVRTLGDLARMSRLRGAETVIVGIQPEIGLAMAQSGLTLEGVATELDLEEGLAHLDRATERKTNVK